MTAFRSLFGIDRTSIKETAVLLPAPYKAFLSEINDLRANKGKLYKTMTYSDITFICTGIGPAMSGDAVLYLKDTPCKRVILFGTCGLASLNSGLRLGDIVLPLKCFELESFSRMLELRLPEAFLIPDKTITAQISADFCIHPVTVITAGSLKLESDYSDILPAGDPVVFDMEFSAVLSAAKSSCLPCAAIFVISDMIGDQPFYSDLNDTDKESMAGSFKKAAELICRMPSILT